MNKRKKHYPKPILGERLKESDNAEIDKLATVGENAGRRFHNTLNLIYS